MCKYLPLSKIHVIFILPVLIATSCIEEYWPKIDSQYVDALVIDGGISNLPGPYEIKLSLSSEIYYNPVRPLRNCTVIIEEESGTSEELVEIGEGVYRTSADGILGVCGKSYRIKIRTPDGKQYMSDFEEMPLPTPIDTIYYELEYQPHPFFDRNITGYRFFIDTQVSETDTNYYLWNLECTYKFNANYRIKYYFDGQMHPFSPSDSLYTCFKTNNIKEIFLYNTANLEVPVVRRHPLNYVTTETKELSIKYSLLVKQFSLTKSTYEYWNKIKDLNDDQGEIYFKQPFQIKGNVYNSENKDELVLGNFRVAGSSEKRIFIDRPTGVDWYYPDSCNFYPIEKDILYINHSRWPLYLPGSYGEYGYGPAWVDYQWCVNCTAKGLDGYLEEPEFWEE
jgi:hypothetical protein